MSQRRSSFRSLVSFALLILVHPASAPAQVEPPAPPPEDPGAGQAPGTPEKDPEFKKPAALQEFQQAKSLYAEGKFKEAESAFKKVKAEAKGDEDKRVVDVWLQGATGALLLEKCRALAKQNQLQKAYQDAESYSRKYQGTPVAGAYKQFLEEVGGQLFIVIEGFDKPSAEYSEKFGKKFISDPALLLDGSTCLQWASTRDRKDAALKVRDVPPDWSRIEAVELWINARQTPPAPEIIIACGDGKAAPKPAPRAPAAKKKKSGESLTNYYQAPARIPSQTGKWLKVRVPLSDFQPRGTPSLANVTHMQLQLQGGRAYDFLIDRITLVRKDVTAPAAEPKKK